MGVDLGTFRARIGSFAGVLIRIQARQVSTSSLSLLLILVLLLRGGVEQNPGPRNIKRVHNKIKQHALPRRKSELGRLEISQATKSEQAQIVSAIMNINRKMSRLFSIISRASDLGYAASKAPGSLTTSARCCHEAGQPDPSCPDPVKGEKEVGVQPVAEPDFYKASDSLSSRYDSIPLDSLDHEQPLHGNDSDKKDCQHRDNRSREKGSTRGTHSGCGGFSSLTGGSSGGDKGGDDDDDDEKKRKGNGKEPDDRLDGNGKSANDDEEDEQNQSEELGNKTPESSTHPGMSENPITDVAGETDMGGTLLNQAEVGDSTSADGEDRLSIRKEPSQHSPPGDTQRQSPSNELSGDIGSLARHDVDEPSAQDPEPATCLEQRPDTSETEPRSLQNGELQSRCVGGTGQHRQDQAPAASDAEEHDQRVTPYLAFLRQLLQGFIAQSNRCLTLFPSRVRHLENIRYRASVLLHLMDVVFNRASESTVCPEMLRSAQRLFFEAVRMFVTRGKDARGSAAAAGTSSCRGQGTTVSDRTGSNPPNPQPLLRPFRPGGDDDSHPRDQRGRPSGSCVTVVDLLPKPPGRTIHGSNDCQAAFCHSAASHKCETCSPRREYGGRSHFCPSSGVRSWKDCGTDPPQHPSPSSSSSSSLQPPHSHGGRRESTSSEEAEAETVLENVGTPTECTDDQNRCRDDVENDDGDRAERGANAFPPVTTRIQLRLRNPGSSLIAQCCPEEEHDALTSEEESDGDVVDMGHVAAPARKPKFNEPHQPKKWEDKTQWVYGVKPNGEERQERALPEQNSNPDTYSREGRVAGEEGQEQQATGEPNEGEGRQERALPEQNSNPDTYSRDGRVAGEEGQEQQPTGEPNEGEERQGHGVQGQNPNPANRNQRAVEDGVRLRQPRRRGARGRPGGVHLVPGVQAAEWLVARYSGDVVDLRERDVDQHCPLDAPPRSGFLREILHMDPLRRPRPPGRSNEQGVVEVQSPDEGDLLAELLARLRVGRREENRLCLQCQELPADTVFLNCHHIVVCSACAREMPQLSSCLYPGCHAEVLCYISI